MDVVLAVFDQSLTGLLTLYRRDLRIARVFLRYPPGDILRNRPGAPIVEDRFLESCTNLDPREWP